MVTENLPMNSDVEDEEEEEEDDSDEENESDDEHAGRMAMRQACGLDSDGSSVSEEDVSFYGDSDAEGEDEYAGDQEEDEEELDEEELERRGDAYDVVPRAFAY
jgi:hypothetical protein